jgi:HK97 gp10 family phage protein
MARFRADIEGLAELEAQFKKLEKFPKRKVNQASNAGMKPVLQEARRNAPKSKASAYESITKTGTSGQLKKGITKKLEKNKSRYTAKAVYRIVFAPNPNFVKEISKEGQGIYGGKQSTGYYPASMEFGFLSKHGYVQGKKFIRQALWNNKGKSQRIIVQRLAKEVDKLVQ